MAAKCHGADILDRDAGGFGQEAGEAGAIEYARHADDLVGRQSRKLLQSPNHRVERVGDADDEVLPAHAALIAAADLLHDVQIDAQEIVAAHAGLARYARGDDADVGAGDCRITVGAGAGELGVVAFDAPACDKIERLALGHPLDNVRQDDVAELLKPGQKAQACHQSVQSRSMRFCCAPCVLPPERF